eukprot:TRINITY_DN2010_c0_g1_i14.p1 TRINITY_DN2010_c0_g1~~TRINITY_DN2010_c0_g1_i14.p1  ORF type:complete len:224 (-),score=51.66 TRINITY_DN2010_c0_g1_i14:146-817(-)
MSWLKENSQKYLEEDVKGGQSVVQRNQSSHSRRKGVKDSDSEDFFDLKDNENELYKRQTKKSPSRNVRRVSRFELEMNKHGLLEDIKKIRKLSFYLSIGLGSAVNSEENLVYNPSQPKISYEFPFQRRARSSSPPRGVMPFCKAEKGSNYKLPIAAKQNLSLKTSHIKNIKQLLPHQIEGAMIDSFGLSTGPSYEGKKEIPGDELIYQKIIGPIKELSQDKFV